MELLEKIAAVSETSYYAMCSIKRFATGLSADTITNWQIHFGHSVEITSEKISWKRHGKLHRLGGPAEITVNSIASKWCRNGEQKWWYRPEMYKLPDLTAEYIIREKYHWRTKYDS